MQNDMTTKIADRIVAVCEKIGWPEYDGKGGRIGWPGCDGEGEGSKRRVMMYTKKNCSDGNWAEINREYQYWDEQFEEPPGAWRHYKPLADYVGLCVMERHFRVWMDEHRQPCVQLCNNGYMSLEFDDDGDQYVNCPYDEREWLPSYIEAQLTAIEANHDAKTNTT